MKGYLSYFKTVLLSSIQYKTAALAGIFTQFFWGFLQIFIYQAFYSGVGQDVPMDFEKLVAYIWLQQAFLALVYIRNKDESVAKSIKNGTVAYELVRPYNIYVWWFVKCIAQRFAAVSLRCVPILIIAVLLSEPYNLILPSSFGTFAMFIINLLLGALIITSIMMIIQTIAFFTYEDKGISNIIFNFAELLSGTSLPLPLLPKIVQTICHFFPFWLIGDLPFRIYSGDITLMASYKFLGLQIFWIVVLVIIGILILKYAMKKVYIQGG
ncbi:MAG: ABC-2 family transporter protein [Clostridia bacterium]|nr:ABC-2 family transporter protein [Clostridia bacterium]